MSELVRIRFRDVLTGEEGEHSYQTDRLLADDPDDAEGFYWTDGNGACDCERGRVLAATHECADPNVPCGDSRIRIVGAWRGETPVPWDDKP